MAEDLLREETEVLLACKLTPNYKVQFGVPLVNDQAARQLLTMRVRPGGAERAQR